MIVSGEDKEVEKKYTRTRFRNGKNIGVERASLSQRVLRRVSKRSLQFSNEIRAILHRWRELWDFHRRELLSLDSTFFHGIQSSLQVSSQIREVLSISFSLSILP